MPKVGFNRHLRWRRSHKEEDERRSDGAEALLGSGMGRREGLEDEDKRWFMFPSLSDLVRRAHF